MTEQQWLSCGDPQEMLRHLIDGHDERGHGRHPLATGRKLRLFACACVRQVWHLLGDERSRNAVEIAERFADGLATHSARADAWKDATNATWVVQRGQAWNAAWAAAWTTTSRDITWDESWDAVWAIDTDTRPSDLLRDIIGNPFRPVACEARWLTRDVIDMAQGIYEERTMPDGHLDPVRLAILADALEEAGCPERLPCRFCKGKKYVRLETGGALRCDCVEIDQHPLLSHLRSPGPHVRGCWAVDLILGKE